MNIKKDAVLLLVDVQNDFCPGGALPVPDGDKVVVPLSRMLPRVLRQQEWLWWPVVTGTRGNGSFQGIRRRLASPLCSGGALEPPFIALCVFLAQG